eukprot:CAMPEP_0113328872 /NCGR_PEP_ID=MMETSP0010_2-20120614/20395_1 /TAXON_ID=216773 ORGANISM="Corethron hystrix, Strain 308" /NCGR_SAMPLE_ID=MMETSP0010_2 /ASSEMBLY_ACC=CAM_ASM_000155 /LENGTH=47 /DNA_ID=CAMNT_0000190517 /DNA_START=32 /DNA_END=171 /DNA_ORIENTATION=- /assembly_acc=CAM_ASM_000155
MFDVSQYAVAGGLASHPSCVSASISPGHRSTCLTYPSTLLQGVSRVT